ncbi:hypothetical protein PMAYCL1PPCAC_21560, partial [Pristionchus mayeri]
SFWGMMVRSNLTVPDLQREAKEDPRFANLTVQLQCAKVNRGKYGLAISSSVLRAQKQALLSPW